MTKACLCALAVSLVTTGCSDLLDKEPPSAISDGSFWTGEGDAMLALTGCYRFQKCQADLRLGQHPKLQFFDLAAALVLDDFKFEVFAERVQFCERLLDGVAVQDAVVDGGDVAAACQDRGPPDHVFAHGQATR